MFKCWIQVEETLRVLVFSMQLWVVCSVNTTWEKKEVTIFLFKINETCLQLFLTIVTAQLLSTNSVKQQTRQKRLNLPRNLLPLVVEDYQALKTSMNVIDFDDLMSLVYEYMVVEKEDDPVQMAWVNFYKTRYNNHTWTVLKK